MGGNGVNVVSPIGAGGDADAVARATTSGEGDSATSLATATGGTGSLYDQGGIVFVPGAGHATSEATALGEGAARARAYGTGGKGVSVTSPVGGLGQATASAVGQNQLVDALASAVGGQAGPTFDVNNGPSGVALANATATGLATAQALAQTEGGGTSIGHATARQLGYQLVDAGSTTQADLLARSNSFAARALAMDHGDASALLAASGSGAVAIGDPGSAALSSWLDGNPNVQAALGSAPVSGLGLLRVDSSAHHVESFAQFDWVNGLGGEHLVVGFLDPELVGAGFDALHVEIDANDRSCSRRTSRPPAPRSRASTTSSSRCRSPRCRRARRPPCA